MKKIQRWTGKDWEDTSIGELSCGVNIIKIVEVSNPELDLDSFYEKRIPLQIRKKTLQLVRRQG